MLPHRSLSPILALALLLAPCPGAAQEPAPAAAALRGVELRVSAEPTDAQISVDGQLAGSGNWAGRLDPGEHEVRIVREGYQTVLERVVVDPSVAGQTMVLRAFMRKSDPDTVIIERERGPIDRLAGRTAWGWIMTAAGAVLVGGAVVLATLDDACATGPEEGCLTRNATDTEAFVAATAALGGAALVGGLTLLFWYDLAGEPEPQHVPAGGPAVGAKLMWRF